ncbi:MAG TPA: ZIP family metal transporter [Candidatus Bathyarchaeia archaeon]
MDSIVTTAYPILLSLLAGLATGIGGLLVLALGKLEGRFLGFVMGFAGGVMLVVSFLELMAESSHLIDAIWVVTFFTIGATLMMVIDLLLPHMEFGQWEKKVSDRRLFNSGILVALGMSLHNLPEGLVVSAGFGHEANLGILVALMISLHNIPEGIATVTPLVAAGVNKWRAISLATLSGLTEPLGALIGIVILGAAGATPMVIGSGLAFAAGVMTYITMDELIPVAHDFCKPMYKHYVSTGVLTGVVFAQLLTIIF